MKKILLLLIILTIPLSSFALDKNQENKLFKTYYALKQDGSNYYRYIPSMPDYPNEKSYESTWTITKNKVYRSGGIFEKVEYKVLDIKYSNNTYSIKCTGEEEGTPIDFTLTIKFINKDKAAIKGYFQDSENIYTVEPKKYEIIENE